MKFYLPLYFTLLMCISMKMNSQVACDPVGTSTYSVLMPNDTGDMRSFFLLDGLAASNGEYVAAGVLNDGADSDIYFLRLDGIGNMAAAPVRMEFGNALGVWLLNPTERKGLHIIELFNAGTSVGYAIAATITLTPGGTMHMLVARINHNGVVQWARISDQYDVAAVDLLQRTDNGNLLILTSTSFLLSPHMYLIELSMTGNWMHEEAFKPYQVGGTMDKFYPTTMNQYQAGNETNFVVAGSYEGAGEEPTIGAYFLGPNRNSAYSTFSKINIQPNSTAEEPIPHAVVVNGNQIVLAGENRLHNGSGDSDGFLLSTSLPDVNGTININWAKRFWTGNDPLNISNGHRFWDLKANSAGDLLIAANSLISTTPGLAIPYIAKCDATGDIQWSRILNISDQSIAHPLTLDLASDEGLWTGGIAATQNAPFKMFAVKTDALGRLGDCDCYEPYLPPIADYAPLSIPFDFVESISFDVGTSSRTYQHSALTLLAGFCDQHEPNDTPLCETNACQGNTIDISTGIDHQTGQPYQHGVYDAYWQLIESPNNSISTPRPAFVVTPHPAWDALPSGPTAIPQYLSAYPLSAFTTNNPEPGLPYTFSTCFCVCEDSSQVSIDLNAYADDKAEVYLADTFGIPVQGLLSVARTSPYAFDPPPLDTLISTTLDKGTYCINVDLRNTAGVAMGFSLLGTVSGASTLSHKCCNPASTITGTKYNDRNCNGQQDDANAPSSASHEKGLPNWQIQLCDDSGNVLASTTTDGLGFYSFTNLSPGVYTVKESQQAQWEQTEPSGTGMYALTIDSTEVAGFVDFGNHFNGLVSFIDTFDCLTKGYPVTIAWEGGECECMANITLVDCSTGNVQDIALNILNSGSYTWTPPTNLPSGSYQIGISMSGGPGCTIPNAVTSPCFSIENGQAPTVSCPPDITLSTDPGSCENTTFQLAAPVFNTYCPCDEPSFMHVPVGYFGPYSKEDSIFIVQVNDDCGSTLCLVKVNVEDHEPPFIQGCPDNISIVTPSGSNGSVVLWTAPTIGDNCQMASLTCSHNPGDFFECGTTAVTCIATDMSGNTMICEFDVKVVYDSCCTDSLAFLEKINDGFSVQRFDCGILLTPKSLDDCQQVTIDWGDGHTVGPVNGDNPLSHDYNISGDYEICTVVQELNSLGEICFEKDTCWMVCVSCDTCSNPSIISKWSQFPGESPLFKNGSNSHFFISPADLNGDLYVTGSFRGVFQGSGLNNNTGTDDGFVAKYDAAGTLLTNNIFPPFSFGSMDGNDVGTVIKDDGANGFFLAGMYTQPFTLPSPGVPSQARFMPDIDPILIHANGFLAHYSEGANGQILDWAISVDGVDVQLNAISVVSPNEVVFTGLFNNTTKFALHDSDNPNEMVLHTIQGSGAYVAKFDRQNNTILVSTFDGTARGLGVAAYGGDVYIAGDFYPTTPNPSMPDLYFNTQTPLFVTNATSSIATPFVAKLNDSMDLGWRFAIQEEPGKLNTGATWDIEVNANGVYVIGSYSVADVDFDSPSCSIYQLPPIPTSGNFLARYNFNDGCLQKWTKADYPTGFHELELASNGMVYVSGDKGGNTMYLGIYDKDCQFIKSIEPESSNGNLTQAWSVAPVSCSKDFAVIGRFSGDHFDADPMASNGFEFSGMPDTSTIFIGEYTCVCPNPTPETCCDDLEVAVNNGSIDSGCCYSVDFTNNAGFDVTKVEVQLLSSDWSFNNVTALGGFSETHTTNSIVLTYPPTVSGSMGVGTLQFCLNTPSSTAASPQAIVFSWYETRADGMERAICRDTFYTECQPNTCCTDYQAFIDKVNAGFSYTANPSECAVAVTPNSLDSCQQVLSWTWGDGSPVLTGPFGPNASVSHSYDASGDYIACMTVAELLPNGDTCWNLTFCDTISVDCNPACQCSGFSNVTVSVGEGTPQALTCGSTLIISCPTDDLSFTTNFACNPTSCTSENITWWLHKPFTTPVFGDINESGFTVPEALLNGAGTYNLTLTGICAGDSCICGSQIVLLECDTCEIDQLPIRTGYDYTNDTTYPIGVLDPNWRWNPANVASSDNCQTVLPINPLFKPAFSSTEYFANTWPIQHDYYDVKFKFCLPEQYDCQQLHFDLDVRAYYIAEFRINGYPIPHDFIDIAIGSAHANNPDENWVFTPSAADCAYFKPGANIINVRMYKRKKDPLLNISGTLTQTGGAAILMNGDCCEWPVDDDCNCEKLQFDVDAGFKPWKFTQNQLCRRSYKPNSLQPCDLVEWTVDGDVVANTMANQPFSHDLSNGTYEICMKVTRVTATGSSCAGTHCQDITIFCPTSAPLPSASIHNFGFNNGSLEGIIGQGGATQNWYTISGEPYLKGEPGCLDDWDLILSGNFFHTDAVQQEIEMLAGVTYSPQMYAAYYYPLKDTSFIPRILLLASKDSIVTANCPEGCEIIGEYGQPLSTDKWHHIEWPEWTPTEAYKYLTVMIENLVDDDGSDENRNFIVVDNVGLDMVNGTNEIEDWGIRLSPNPTSGHFNLFFNEPISSPATLRIMGLKGDVLKTYQLQIGKRQYDFSIAELPSGAYFVKIENDKGQAWVEKILKQ